ncbi:MAG TPA: hypothetical protein VFJ19_14680 [Nocardioidaceae bacterium]|nr:hypothetical protein [Nocardioidaceae bacterium]
MTAISITVPRGVEPGRAKAVIDRLLESEARVARVSEALAKESGSIGPGTLAQIGRVDRAWRDMESRYGLYTAEQVAALTGASAKAGAQHVYNLRRRKGLLAGRRAGINVYPGFQFTGRESLIVRREWRDLVAPLLTAGWSEDEVLLWFAGPVGVLDGRHPADLLDSDADAVREAVEQAAAGPVW